MGRLIPPVVPAGTLAAHPQPEVTVDAELVLRPFEPGDVAAVIEAFTTPDIEYYHFRRFDNEAEALSWIGDRAAGWRAERAASWAITERATGTVLGRVSIALVLEDGYGEVGYWVLPRGRGRGVATRACVAATRWAHQLGLHRIQLQHSTTNEGSRRVALASGFVYEGVRRGSNLHADGWHDMVLYSHLSSDGFGDSKGFGAGALS